jgi:hypothetical protein
VKITLDWGTGSFYCVSMSNSNEKIHSPVRIEVLLHCYVNSSEPIPRIESRAVIEALSFLFELGAITNCCGSSSERPRYKTTPLGEAWVRALERVACPSTAFIDDRGYIL